jgi:hypothetical protein
VSHYTYRAVPPKPDTASAGNGFTCGPPTTSPITRALTSTTPRPLSALTFTAILEADDWLKGASVVGAAGDAPTLRVCSESARAKSLQRAKRLSGSLARAASTGSSAASSGRVSASAGGAVLSWRLMTTAGLEWGNSGVPARTGQQRSA